MPSSEFWGDYGFIVALGTLSFFGGVGMLSFNAQHCVPVLLEN